MYSLTERDMEVLRYLLKEGTTKAEDLADRLGRDRSTVYGSLQKLVSCQIAHKESKSLERGGYFHVYSSVPRDLLRDRLERCIEDWHTRMLSLLANFDEDMANL